MFTAEKKRLSETLPHYCVLDQIQERPHGELQLFPGMTIRDVPAHVCVFVTAHPEPESNIKIELWIPLENWNGDLAAIGNGGSAGSLPSFMLSTPLRLGFAAVTTDMGTSAGSDCGIGNKAVWKDFGYRATHIMAIIGKQLTAAWFDRPVQYAYFIGNSTGGQQALSEAQRYPEDFNGILSSAPAYDRVNLHMAFVWDWQALTAEGVEPFTQEMERNIVQTFLNRCSVQGKRCGKKEFFDRPDHIVITRDILEETGLTDHQMNALMKVYEGLQGIYEPTLTPGSEADPLGICYRADKERFQQEFFYIFRWALGKNFDFSKFDFERDGKKVQVALSEYLDATSTDLSAFRNHGGKLLLIHGTADPIIPMTSSIRYFQAVQDKMGDTSDFFRMFLMPGMGHGVGGPGVQDYVIGFSALPKDEKHFGLLTLKAWVEQGKAPDVITPVSYKPGSDPAHDSDSVNYEMEVKPFQSAL